MDPIINFARKYFGQSHVLENFIRQNFRLRYRDLKEVGNGYRYDGVFEECPDTVMDRPITPEEQCLITSLLNTEGRWCSLNTYDDQIFTLGPGFAQTGKELGIMLFGIKHSIDKLPNSNMSKAEWDLRHKAGLEIKYTPEGTCYLAMLGENRPCYSNIRKNKTVLSNMISVLEKHRSTIIEAVCFALLKPGSTIDRVTKFGEEHWKSKIQELHPEYSEKDLQHELLKMEIAAMHLAHWRPSSGFTNGHWSQFYQYCGSVAQVIILAYTIMDYQDAVSVKRKPHVQKFGDAMSCAGIIPYNQCVERMNNWYLGDEILDDLLSGSTERAEMVNHDESKPGYLYFQLGKNQKSYLRIQKYLVTSSEEFVSNLKNNTNIIA